MLIIERVQWDARPNFKISITGHAIRENIWGILLAVIFFGIYLYFGLQLLDITKTQVDNLFDADTSSWIRRISSMDVKDFQMRGPHPFTYFILRPFGLFLNLFTRDPAHSAILLNSLVGALCVFLVWVFLHRQFQIKQYASLMAAFLGISSSHLFLSSVVETYIFSAFALILFFLILQTNPGSLLPVIASGILTFGITLTNFVQNLIGFVVSRPRIKDIIRFAGWVLSVSLLLSYIHAAIYTGSKLFFLSQDAKFEDKFFLRISIWPHWRMIGRLIYQVRTTFLYTAVAPDVFVLREEVGSNIPEFRFWKLTVGTFHQAQYEGLGQILVLVWALMLFVSGIVFLWNLLRLRKTDASLAFVLCIAFNTVLHINYGQEIFLYSPDWTYALILFTAFGLAPFAKNRFFQAGLAIFILALVLNQWIFMNVIVKSLMEFIPM